jgi:hypothetical protein
MSIRASASDTSNTSPSRFFDRSNPFKQSVNLRVKRMTVNNSRMDLASDAPLQCVSGSNNSLANSIRAEGDVSLNAAGGVVPSASGHSG